MKAEGDAKVGQDARSEGQNTLLSLVVPVLNESEAVGHFVDRVTEVFPPSSRIAVEVVFVNDGSSDDTLARVLELQKSSPLCIKLVDLSRNFGKEAALSAGLHYARGDVIVPIDVDLQDPPELIPRMIEKWREGYEVVVGKRANREADTWPKRASSELFYRVHNLISSPPIPPNVGDFRLMDRSVVDALLELPESRRFTKGLFAWIGFRTTGIEYARPERVAGKTKFNGWKLWNFALEGLTSFSTVPLRMWTYIGLFVSLASFAFGVFIALRVVVSGVDVPGYASLMVAVTFLGGLQLIGIGVLGEYLGRTYIESKRRPTYVVRRMYDTED